MKKTLLGTNRWMFPKIGVPQNGWFIMENPKIDDLGVFPYFWKHPDTLPTKALLKSMIFRTSPGGICDRSLEGYQLRIESTRNLEDHPRTCKWLGSPLFTSHGVRPFIKGMLPRLGDATTITMVINHHVSVQVLGAHPPSNSPPPCAIAPLWRPKIASADHSKFLWPCDNIRSSEGCNLGCPPSQ